MKFKISYIWMIGGCLIMINALLYLPNIIHSSLIMITGILALIYSGILDFNERRCD